MTLPTLKLAILALALLLFTSSCTNRSAKTEQTKDEKKEAAAKNETDSTHSKSKYEIRKELAGYFSHQKDGSTEQVQSKQVTPAGTGTYCYFYIKGNRAVSLKLRINYPQHNANLYELEAGGEVQVYKSNKTHATQQTATIAEGATFQWYDKTINEEDEAFIRKAAELNAGATLRMKYKDESKELEVTTIQLSKEDCQTLVRTIDYYKSLNGATIPKKGMVNIRG